MDSLTTLLLVFVVAAAIIILIAVLIGHQTRARLLLPGKAEFYIETTKGWQPVPPKGRQAQARPGGMPARPAQPRPRTRLVAHVRGGPDWEYLLEGKPTFYIGRRQDNDIVLLDPTTDTRQAVIYLQEGRYRINNLSPRVPTMVNGRPITMQNLGDGNTIQMGNTRLIFRQER